MTTRAFMVGSDGATPLTLADYRVDRFEVSNSQYKAFVDAGGYADRKYWEHDFVGEDGRKVAFDAAIAGFVDRTGRPGPATWEAGTFPTGLGDLPSEAELVQAAAFAKSPERSLPTVYHWSRAAAAFNSK